MLAFLNTPTFPVFSPPTYFNPAFILRFYLSFIFYLAFIYCVLLFTNIIYHVMRTDTCNKPHTLRDAVTGRNRNRETAAKGEQGEKKLASVARSASLASMNRLSYVGNHTGRRLLINPHNIY